MTVEATPEAFDLQNLIDEEKLTPAARRALAGESEGAPWENGDRLFTDWDTGLVFDYGEPNAKGIGEMLDTDGTARQLEQVLALPLRAAPVAIVGGTAKGRAEVTRQVPEELLRETLAQQTSAIAYRKAFHELEWTLDGRRVDLKSVGFRPARSCEAAYTVKGKPSGFRQRIANFGRISAEDWAKAYQGEMPGWCRITQPRSLIYTHGTHREPLKGISDLSVAWWAYETRKKLMFLWLQYIELQSQPKVLVYGRDMAQAKRNLKAIAGLVAGGYAPAERPDEPTAKVIEILETSGKGAGLFQPAVMYLEAHMADSVLAGFTKMPTGAGVNGAGSRALSTDASEFFRDSRQAVADEQARQIARQLFARVCIYNGLTPADIPTLRVGPLSKQHIEQALEMAGKLITAPTVNAPPEFLSSLLKVVAPMLGLDADKLGEAIERHATEKAEQKASAALGAALGGDQTGPGGPPQRAGAPDQAAAELANTVDTAEHLVRRAHELGDADAALAELNGDRMRHRTHIDLAAGNSGETGGKDPAQDAHTGGMVCLVPDEQTAERLLINHPKAEPRDQLHLTLAFLGDDVRGAGDNLGDRVLSATRVALGAAGVTGAVEARAFSHNTFNADGGPQGDRDPCAVYGIGDSPVLAPLQRRVVRMLDEASGEDWQPPAQHDPYIPHVTAAYGATGADLSYLGPVRFDRVAVVIGGDWTFLPLTTGGDDV